MIAEVEVVPRPLAPQTVAESGLSLDLIQQLLLKTLHFSGELRGTELARRLGLQFSVLEPALDFLRDFRYTDDDLAYLSQLKHYDPAFLDELREYRFRGEILAMPEGTIAFPNEPLVRVTGGKLAQRKLSDLTEKSRSAFLEKAFCRAPEKVLLHLVQDAVNFLVDLGLGLELHLCMLVESIRVL